MIVSHGFRTDLVIYVVDGSSLVVIDGTVLTGIIGNSDDLIGTYGLGEVKVRSKFMIAFIIKVLRDSVAYLRLEGITGIKEQ